MTNKYTKGFTLIELLIVITIIGILAAAFLPSVLNAPAKARDATRITTIGNIAGALELYASDNGGYPPVGSNGCLDTASMQKYFPANNIPTDPSNSHSNLGCTGGYYYCLDTTDTNSNYILAAVLEEKASKSANAYAATTTAAPGACSKAGFAAATGGSVNNVYYLIK